MASITNKEFGERVGIHHSMASRVRAGKRLPGVEVIGRISEVYGIPLKTLLKARDNGPEEFGKVIRKRVFGAKEKAAA